MSVQDRRENPRDGLAGSTCMPCSAGEPPLRGPEIAARLQHLGAGWQIVNESQLEKQFRFSDFKEALAFTNRVGAQAERLGHHPAIRVSWGRVTVTTWTRKSGGLTDGDFLLARATDAVQSEKVDADDARI
jgi:4a-hydroxytetrahydrobiopterin dehydratase